MMKQITLAEFIALYEAGDVQEVVVVGTKIYGRTAVNAADKPKGRIVVWANQL